MSMVINHNLASLNTYNKLNANTNSMNKALEKLSSGYRINNAADDAAGLAISEKMRGQISGLDQASSNAQDAVSLVQTADGALEETTSILQRMRELAVQSSSDTNTDSDRSNIQDEIDALTAEIDNIGNTTEFNTKKLLNGGTSVAATNAVGTNVSGNASTSDLTVTGGTGDTKVGSTVAITAATKATSAAKTIGAAATFTSLTTNLTAASTITVNDVSFSFTTSNDTQDVLDAVNNAGIGVKATWDATNGIQVTSTTEGSAGKIVVNTAGTGNLSAGTAGTTQGTDATITTASGSYVADGNTITMTSGNAKGLSFTVNNDIANTDAETLTVSSNGTLTFQIGANEGQTMGLGISDMRAAALGVANLDVSTAKAASSAITTIDAATATVSSQRSKLGAVQNRLESTINNLTTTSENLTSAESGIRDVDMASEMANYTKLSVITQAATAMLAQANQQPQQVLKLLS